MELEDTIRERAYFISLADGNGGRNADVHWLTAENEILVAAMEAVALIMTQRNQAVEPSSKQKARRRSRVARVGAGSVPAEALSS